MTKPAGPAFCSPRLGPLHAALCTKSKEVAASLGFVCCCKIGNWPLSDGNSHRSINTTQAFVKARVGNFILGALLVGFVGILFRN